MTKDEVQDFAEVIRGYDAWRKHKIQELERSDYHLSASEYLDELANKRNADALDELRDLFGNEDNFDLTTADIFDIARNILGIKS